VGSRRRGGKFFEIRFGLRVDLGAVISHPLRRDGTRTRTSATYAPSRRVSSPTP
jgi:hypothetical protein